VLRKTKNKMVKKIKMTKKEITVKVHPHHPPVHPHHPVQKKKMKMGQVKQNKQMQRKNKERLQRQFRERQSGNAVKRETQKQTHC
jgi:hypothetical protein